jgi:hypothetical protein
MKLKLAELTHLELQQIESFAGSIESPLIVFKQSFDMELCN